MEKVNDNLNMNYVEARGRIIGSYVDNEGRKKITLHIRGARQRKGTYLSFALKDGIETNFKLQDNVFIKGYLMAYRRNSELWTVVKPFDQTLVAEEIIVEKSEIEEVFGIKGGFSYKEPYVKLYLSGTVIETENLNNSKWNIITLRVENDGFKPYEIRVQYSRNMRVNDNKINVGDKVAIIAIIVSAKKTYKVNSRINDSKNENGERTVIKYFENIIINDLVFIEKAKAEETAK